MTIEPASPLVVCASHSPAMTRDPCARQGLIFRAGLDQARAAIADLDPNLIVIFAPDHRRVLRAIVPAFTVVASATGLGDFGGDTGPYTIDTNHAEAIGAGLLNNGFDIAIARNVRLDHGTGQTLTYLVGALDAVPTLPVLINCATPPFAPTWRVQQLGQTIGRLLGDNATTVMIGSGGLSHAPPSLAPDLMHADDATRAAANHTQRAQAAERIDPEWDTRVLRAFAENDTDWLAQLTDTRIDPAGWGAHEVRTWIAAHAAAGGGPLRSVYEPVAEWITGMAVAVSDHTTGEGA